MSEEQTPSVRPKPGSTAWRLWRRIFIATAVLGSMYWFVRPVERVAPTKKAPSSRSTVERLHVQTEDDLKKIKDPTVLVKAGRRLLKTGNKALAKKCFEQAVSLDEINKYSRYAKTPFGTAVVAEYMGEFDKSRKIWRDRIEHDVTSTLFF